MSTRQTAEFSRTRSVSMSSSPAPARATYRKHWLLVWIGGIFAVLIVSLFIGSFFLDDMIRLRTQAAMNQKLTGYHVALAGACSWSADVSPLTA